MALDSVHAMGATLRLRLRFRGFCDVSVVETYAFPCGAWERGRQLSRAAVREHGDHSSGRSGAKVFVCSTRTPFSFPDSAWECIPVLDSTHGIGAMLRLRLRFRGFCDASVVETYAFPCGAWERGRKLSHAAVREHVSLRTSCNVGVVYIDAFPCRP